MGSLHSLATAKVGLMRLVYSRIHLISLLCFIILYMIRPLTLSSGTIRLRFGDHSAAPLHGLLSEHAG